MSLRRSTVSSTVTPRSIKALVLALGLLVLGLLALACRQEVSPPPNVVLITIDTLRADRLACYGSKTTRTPNIDRLASEGLVFDRANAPLPETRPSHYTMFTSLYPGDHGVVSNASSPEPDLVTLPSVYRRAGYATAGVGGCGLFDQAAGASLGFEDFDAPKEPQRPADKVVRAALDWLAGWDGQRPFFLWLHLFDPHMPYLPPPPFNGKSAPEEVAALPSFSWPEMLEIADNHDGDLPEPVFRRALELYEGEVEWVDHWLGRFFEALRTQDLYDDAVIVLTADHGECFENGVFFDHSQCLGEGALKVPLILRDPRRVEPGRTEAPVEHLDLAPTLLRLSGLEVPETMRGRGLLARGPLARQREGAASDVFFQHPLYRRSDVANRQTVLDQLRSVAGQPTRAITSDHLPFGVRRGPWKYVRAGDREALYNLAEDPDERVDRADQETELVRDLRHAAWQWLKEHPVQLRDTGDLDPKLVERLKALGYL